MGVSPFKSIKKDLDPSHKMDIDSWTDMDDKTYFIAQLHNTDLDIWATSGVR